MTRPTPLAIAVLLVTASAFASHTPNQAPHAESGGPYWFECTAPGQATGRLDGSGTHDHETGALMMQWTSSCLGTTMLFGIDPVWTLPVGAPGPCSYTCDLALQVRDMGGLADVDNTEVVVADSMPPVIVSANADPLCLWPPNHRIECFDGVFASAAVFDVCDPNPTFLSVSCAIEGDPTATSSDCSYDPVADRMCVRVQRGGKAKSGRTYRLNAVARDACGNESAPVAVFAVVVPHDRGQAKCAGPVVTAPLRLPPFVPSVSTP